MTLRMSSGESWSLIQFRRENISSTTLQVTSGFQSVLGIMTLWICGGPQGLRAHMKASVAMWSQLDFTVMMGIRVDHQLGTSGTVMHSSGRIHHRSQTRLWHRIGDGIPRPSGGGTQTTQAIDAYGNEARLQSRPRMRP